MISAVIKSQSLAALLTGFVADTTQVADCMLSGLVMDSRRAEAGVLFLALAKHAQDRLKHFQQVVDNGAFAVLFEQQQPLNEAEAAVLDSAKVMAYGVNELADKAGNIAARFYDYPSQHMQIIAVTGTNGKTSVTQFIAQGLEANGHPCGVIGTMGAGRLTDMELTGMTTPDPVSVQRMLASFYAEGCTHVTIEASSHALEQGRLNAVDVDVAVFTNLTRDHLDYHKTMEAYGAAKQRLFEMPSVKTVVVNQGDEFGEHLLSLQVLKSKKQYAYSSVSQSVIQAKHIVCDRQGLQFELINKGKRGQVTVPVMGRFNVDNLLAAYGTFTALGYSHHEALTTLEQCHAVAGRMEAYGVPNQPLVIIDYAHTPDALEQALKTLRSHIQSNGQLWCVFGCGGDRDRGKRPLMGKIAERDADHVVVTDDNPRTEDHQIIVQEILSGCESPEQVYVELDRKAAITYAITHASADDIILVAGKGHEAYQDINHIKYPFSDALVVGEVISDMQPGVYSIAGGYL
jgi:UDP-N-acetylmuramoyl-L-alanyl-D-glutamate--2,6-diaminopimelate ligase